MPAVPEVSFNLALAAFSITLLWRALLPNPYSPQENELFVEQVVGSFKREWCNI
jgi:hypothetical protein